MPEIDGVAKYLIIANLGGARGGEDWGSPMTSFNYGRIMSYGSFIELTIQNNSMFPNEYNYFICAVTVSLRIKVVFSLASLCPHCRIFNTCLDTETAVFAFRGFSCH